MLTEFIAEMGDKTQLMLVGMSVKYKMRDVILGTAVAILVLNGLAVLLGGLVGEMLPEWVIKLAAALAFLFFAYTTIQKEDDEEEDVKNIASKFAPLAVFCTFFLAELGDKTQLTAVTFGASEGLANGLIVWIACSVGLFAADMVGLVIIALVRGKMPEGLLKIMAFGIFSVYGIVTLTYAMNLIAGEGSNAPLRVAVITTVAFIIVCVIRFKKVFRNTKE